MTSNRKAKKQQPSPIEAHRLINRQFYRRMRVMDYPDIIHVKNDDPNRSDVVCLKTFGQCYMDVVPLPATPEDDYQTTQYIRPRMLVEAWKERIYDCIERLKADQRLMFAKFPHDYDGNSTSKIIEGLYIAVGNMESMLHELEDTGTIRPYDKEREEKEFRERIDKLNQTK